MSTDHELSGDYGDQLALLADVPEAGQAFRDLRSGSIVVVLTVTMGRKVTVTIRVSGEERVVTLGHFRAHYRRCRPDGRLL